MARAVLQPSPEDPPMTDVLLVALTFGLFGATVVFLRLCERM